MYYGLLPTILNHHEITMKKQICLINFGSDSNPQLTPTFFLDGIHVCYSIGYGRENGNETDVTITSQLGQIKKNIMYQTCDKVFINPIMSDDPEFIQKTMIKRFNQIKELASDNEHLGILFLFLDEKHTTSFFKAFELIDENKMPAKDLEHTSLEELGISLNGEEEEEERTIH